MKNADGDAVVVVFVSYFMSPDFYNVVLMAEVMVCAKSDALQKIAKKESYAGNDVPVLYRNKIQTAWRMPGVDKAAKLAPEAVAANWTAADTAKLRTALDAAAGELAELAHWDMEQPARDDYGNSGATVFAQIYDNNSVSTRQATVYRYENHRLWLRTKDGRLYAQSD